MSKRERSNLDRVFGALLCACVTAMIVSGIAWALGWENGPYVVLIFGGLANVPMFHFAMNWPLRVSKKSEKGSGEQSATAPESKLEPESEGRSQ